MEASDERIDRWREGGALDETREARGAFGADVQKDAADERRVEGAVGGAEVGAGRSRGEGRCEAGEEGAGALQGAREARGAAGLVEEPRRVGKGVRREGEEVCELVDFTSREIGDVFSPGHLADDR